MGGTAATSMMMRSPSVNPAMQNGQSQGQVGGGIFGNMMRQQQRPIFPANGMPTPPVMNIGNQQGFLNNVQQPDSPLSSIDPNKLNPDMGFNTGTVGGGITGGFDLMKLLGLR